MQSISGIHCKVACYDQFRRFLFNGTEFSSLYTQIKQLLSLEKEFVLKYKDNEGDLITISSNEELVCALSCSVGNILRLSVVPNEPFSTLPVPLPSGPVPLPAGPVPETFPYSPVFQYGPPDFQHGPPDFHHGPPDFQQHHPFPHHHGHGGGFGGRGRGGKWGRRGGWGRFQGDHEGGKWGPEMFKTKLTSKRDAIQGRLAELASIENPNQQQLYRQELLKEKLSKIEGRLAKIEEFGGRGWEKAEKHKAKHKMAKEWKHGKGKPELSEEVRGQVDALKAQIDSLKPAFKETKLQLRTKKAALKEAKGAGGDTQQLSSEIAALKEVRKGQKSQIRPLQEQIYGLKNPH